MEPEAIERAAAAAWPSAEVEVRDGWLLRHTPGLDRARSNAGLPLTPEPDPGVVVAWCAARGAVPLVQVAPLEGRTALDQGLAGAGWAELMRVDVLTAPSTAIGPPREPVAVLTTPAPRWLAAWGRAEGRQDVEAHRREVFARIPAGRAGYALVGGGSAVGLAIATDDGACGLFCMATHPEARRRGLASAVVEGLAEWARGAGSSLLYLQVLTSNAAARGLYERAGFTRSHGYVHRAFR